MNDDLSELVKALADTEVPQNRSTARRTKEDRGLPKDEAITEMAVTYLTEQAKHWPEFVKKGLIPKNTPATCNAYVNDFKARFFGKTTVDLREYSKIAIELAAAYARFSSDNSNPRSLSQQLKNVLEKAKSLGYFIPWALVFADAAITGTVANRIGYQNAQQAVFAHEDKVAGLIIDEIGRAARDAIEALSLGRRLDRKNKRFVGASDGFDSTQPQSKIMLAVYAMLQEWFVDQLRSKVRRGQADAFSRRGVLGRVCPGYKKVPLFDSAGRPVHGKDDAQMNTLAVDEESAAVILQCFKWYAGEGGEGRKSTAEIARHLNSIRFWSSTAWDRGRVVKLLKRRTYIGIVVHRLTYQTRDPDTGGVTVHYRPRNEWLFRRDRTLRIVPVRLFKIVQRRLKEVGDAYRNRQPSKASRRTEMYPTMLIRPVCGSCGASLVYGRSGGSSSLCCPHGHQHKHGCKMHSYKSKKLFEAAMLSGIKTALLQGDLPDQIAKVANGYLEEFRRRPKTSAQPIKKELDAAKARLSNLWKFVEYAKIDNDSAQARIAELNFEVETLQRQLQDVQAQNVQPPKPVTSASVRQLIEDLQALLNRDVRAAAPILAELLGPVVVTDKKAAKRGYDWIAKFTMNLVPVFVRISMAQANPNSGTWEFLNTRSWTYPIDQTVNLNLPTPKYEQLAGNPAFLDMVKKNARAEVAAAFETDKPTVFLAVRFAETGVRPNWSKPKRTPLEGPGRNATKYKGLAPQVLTLRDERQWTFPRIAKNLKVTVGTVTRAYDFGHPKHEATEPTTGKLSRGRYAGLEAELRQAIRDLIAEGNMGDKEIAQAVGCTKSTVWRMRRAMRAAGGTMAHRVGTSTPVG